MDLKELYNFSESLTIFNETQSREGMKVFFDHKRKCFYYSLTGMNDLEEQLVFEDSVQLVFDEQDFKHVTHMTETEFEMNLQRSINSFVPAQHKLSIENKTLEAIIREEQERLLLSEKIWETEATTSIKVRLLPVVKVFSNSNGKLLGYVRLDEKIVKKLESGKCFIDHKIGQKRTLLGWDIARIRSNEEMKDMFEDLETDYYYIHLNIDEDRRVFEYVFFDKKTERRDMTIEIETVEELHYFTEIILSNTSDIFVDNWFVLYENTFI